MAYKIIGGHPLKGQEIGVIEGVLPRPSDNAPYRFQQLRKVGTVKIVSRFVRGRWPSRFDGHLMLWVEFDEFDRTIVYQPENGEGEL